MKSKSILVSAFILMTAHSIDASSGSGTDAHDASAQHNFISLNEFTILAPTPPQGDATPSQEQRVLGSVEEVMAQQQPTGKKTPVQHLYGSDEGPRVVVLSNVAGRLKVHGTKARAKGKLKRADSSPDLPSKPAIQLPDELSLNG